MKPLLWYVSSLLAASCCSAASPGMGSQPRSRTAVEIESVPTVAEWKLETAAAGFTGTGYYVWRGAHVKREPGTGTLQYRVNLAEGGRYLLRIRARRDQEGPTRWKNDRVNDVFVRIDGGPWTKASHKTPWGQWGWIERVTRTRDEPEPAEYELEAGDHRVEIAARSEGGVKIDSFELVPLPGASAAKP